jgi:single-strand DNA-binding protein
MGSVNKVFLVGNLGRDAEQRHTAAGRAVSNFTLATTDTWTDKASGQRQERTEWHRVVVWGRQAESLQPYLTKGKQICVEGRLQTREWNDRDGNKRYTTEVQADRITLLGGRGDSGGGGGRDMAADRGQDAPASGPADLTEDDIPF